jgi:hypothetical protein
MNAQERAYFQQIQRHAELMPKHDPVLRTHELLGKIQSKPALLQDKPRPFRVATLPLPKRLQTTASVDTLEAAGTVYACTRIVLQIRRSPLISVTCLVWLTCMRLHNFGVLIVSEHAENVAPPPPPPSRPVSRPSSSKTNSYRGGGQLALSASAPALPHSPTAKVPPDALLSPIERSRNLSRLAKVRDPLKRPAQVRLPSSSSSSLMVSVSPRNAHGHHFDRNLLSAANSSTLLHRAASMSVIHTNRPQSAAASATSKTHTASLRSLPVKSVIPPRGRVWSPSHDVYTDSDMLQAARGRSPSPTVEQVGTAGSGDAPRTRLTLTSSASLPSNIGSPLAHPRHTTVTAAHHHDDGDDDDEVDDFSDDDDDDFDEDDDFEDLAPLSSDPHRFGGPDGTLRRQPGATVYLCV